MTVRFGVAASLLLLPSALAAGLYPSNSPVLQVDAGNYKDLIGNSNHTSIVEFYAPWCGHCKNLQPIYEKAAKSLAGFAKVAAVNCDDESNKPFCGSMGVQGFPTLKTVKPGRVKDGKRGKPIVEDYQGARTAKSIVDAVLDKIPNHVKRLTDKDFEGWLEDGDGPKAILFSEKSTISATLKSLAIDFLGGISVGQARNNQKQVAEVFAIERYPTLVLLPGTGKDPVVYEGEMKKAPMLEFLSQATAPNPDPAPKKAKAKSSSSKDKGKSAKASSSQASKSFAKASASQASEEAKTAKPSQTVEDFEDQGPPTESPDPDVSDEDTPRPIQVPIAEKQVAPPPLATLDSVEAVQRECLTTQSGTCVLLLGAAAFHADSEKALAEAADSLSHVRHKHVQAKRSIFPFYQLASGNPAISLLVQSLGLQEPESQVLLVAINGKRGWYRQYTQASVGRYALEDWIDAIKMGDGEKHKLADNVLVEAESLPPMPEKKININLDDLEAARQKMTEGGFQEGLDFEMEEVDDAMYAQILEEARQKAREHADATERDEL